MGTMCENVLTPDTFYGEDNAPCGNNKSTSYSTIFTILTGTKVIEVEKVIKIICDAPDKVKAISEILENANIIE